MSASTSHAVVASWARSCIISREAVVWMRIRARLLRLLRLPSLRVLSAGRPVARLLSSLAAPPPLELLLAAAHRPPATPPLHYTPLDSATRCLTAHTLEREARRDTTHSRREGRQHGGRRCAFATPPRARRRRRSVCRRTHHRRYRRPTGPRPLADDSDHKSEAHNDTNRDQTRALSRMVRPIFARTVAPALGSTASPTPPTSVLPPPPATQIGYAHLRPILRSSLKGDMDALAADDVES